jgi:hypothetical protein
LQARVTIRLPPRSSNRLSIVITTSSRQRLILLCFVGSLLSRVEFLVEQLPTNSFALERVDELLLALSVTSMQLAE